MACRSGFEDHEIAIKHSSVKKELDVTTALLCSLITELKTKHVDVLNSICIHNPSLLGWYNQQNRWYAHYKDAYPNFSKEEIIKLIDNKFLKEV